MRFFTLHSTAHGGFRLDAGVSSGTCKKPGSYHAHAYPSGRRCPGCDEVCKLPKVIRCGQRFSVDNSDTETVGEASNA